MTCQWYSYKVGRKPVYSIIVSILIGLPFIKYWKTTKTTSIILPLIFMMVYHFNMIVSLRQFSFDEHVGTYFDPNISQQS